MYVVLGLLGLKKKKKIHVYVVLGLLGLKKKEKKIHVHEVLSPWFEKKKIHVHVLQGEAPETQRFTRPAALCCPPPYVVEEPAADHAGMVRKFERRGAGSAD